VKAEYLYYNLGSISHLFFDPTVTGSVNPVFNAKAAFSGHVLRVGLNYKFGGPAFGLAEK
jgi:outer membrane immunogenic protein